MHPGAQIIEACVEAFFSAHPLEDARLRKRLCVLTLGRSRGSEFVAEASSLIQKSGYMSPPASRGSLSDMAGESRLRLFEDIARALASNFKSWLQGVDPDVLPEFPAQELIWVVPGAQEIVDWRQHWPACGGKLHGKRMVALKWDLIWWNISAFRLPFPPFQIGSGYDVEDVDADEADTLGFHVPANISVNVGIALDVADLTRRFAENLAAYRSKFRV